MTKKHIIISLTSVLLASYGGFFVYQRIQRKKSDKAEDSYEEALEKLKKSKERAAPLYIKPDLEASVDTPSSFNSILDSYNSYNSYNSYDTSN